MRTVRVEHNQSLFDVALQHCGDATAAFDIADLNNMAVTELLKQGMLLTVPEPLNPAVVAYYRNNGIVPATMPSPELLSELIEDDPILEPIWL